MRDPSRSPVPLSGTGHPYTDAIQAAVIAGPFDLSVAHWRPWRVGRKVSRTIYAMVGEYPSDDDVLVGVMDTPALATDAVDCHNLILKEQRRV